MARHRAPRPARRARRRAVRRELAEQFLASITTGALVAYGIAGYALVA